MALQQTDLLSAFTQTFRQDRQMFVDAGVQEGVVGAGDFKVTPGGASLQWSVAAGAAWVQGDDTTRQGLYHQINDAAVTGLVSAGHATLPRIDQVVLQMADSSVTGASNTPTLITVVGTATSGATLDNRTGAAALPNSALRLADILVPAALSGTISAANIRDRRPWARGARYTIIGSNSGNPTTTLTTLANVSTLFDARVECSGAPLDLQFTCNAFHSVAGGQIIVAAMIDGTEVARAMSQTVANSVPPLVLDAPLAPAAGSHLVQIFWSIFTAGTGTMLNSSGLIPRLRVREDVRQNASNT